MMLPSTRRERTKLVLGVTLLVISCAAISWVIASGQLPHFIWRLLELRSSKEEFRDYLMSWGTWAPVAFIFLQALQVVVAPIPGEFTGFVGGFVFGIVRGVFYSTVGLTVGSAIAFLAARVMGYPLLKLVLTAETLKKFHFMTEPRGAIATLVLFAIPGFPKDILSYLLGLSPMSFKMFIIVCAAGRIPGTIMLVLSGAAFYKENWYVIAGLSVICVILLVVYHVNRKKIRKWIGEKTPWHHDNGS